MAQASLPLVGWIITWLDDHYRLLAFNITTEGADTVFAIRANLARPLVIGGRVFIPHPLGWAQVTTPVGNMLQPAILMLGLLPAWPAVSWREWLLRLLLAVPMLLVLLLLTIPFTLWGFLWDISIQSFEPSRFSPLLIWLHFLEGGGRVIIGILGSIAVLWIAVRLSRSHRS